MSGAVQAPDEVRDHLLDAAIGIRRNVEPRWGNHADMKLVSLCTVATHRGLPGASRPTRMGAPTCYPSPRSGKLRTAGARAGPVISVVCVGAAARRAAW